MAAETKLKSKPTAPNAVAGSQAKPGQLFEHEHELVAARFSPCGRFLFAGSYDANIYRWDLSDGTRTPLAGHRGWLQGLAFHPDGKRLFTGDSWGGLCCWPYADPSPQPTWTRTDAHSRWMRSLAIKPDGALLATCGADRVVRLWNTADGSPAWESSPQPDDLLCAAFHPDGKALVVGDLKGVATQWNLDDRKAVRRLDAKVLYLRPSVSGVREINDVGGIRSIAFDATGSLLICGGSQPVTSGFFTGKPTIVLLDWASGERKQVLQWENADPSEGITLDVVWHSAGFIVAASSGQPGKGAFYCWRPGEAAPFRLDKKLAHCRSVSVHPDSKRVAVTLVHGQSGQSGGNGRKVSKDGEYLGLAGQIRLSELEAT